MYDWHGMHHLPVDGMLLTMMYLVSAWLLQRIGPLEKDEVNQNDPLCWDILWDRGQFYLKQGWILAKQLLTCTSPSSRGQVFASEQTDRLWWHVVFIIHSLDKVSTYTHHPRVNVGKNNHLLEIGYQKRDELHVQTVRKPY